MSFLLLYGFSLSPASLLTRTRCRSCNPNSAHFQLENRKFHRTSCRRMVRPIERQTAYIMPGDILHQKTSISHIPYRKENCKFPVATSLFGDRTRAFGIFLAHVDCRYLATASTRCQHGIISKREKLAANRRQIARLQAQRVPRLRVWLEPEDRCRVRHGEDFG